jgi:Tol biopolymer transport system component
LSADGRRLAYAAFTQTANVWSLPVTGRVPLSSSVAKPVTTGNQAIESFDVSDDGRWLAFDSDRNGNQDIFRAPLDGGAPEQLTSDSADDFQPQWSHDGRQIAFHTFRNRHDRDLYVMSATGSDQQPVVATSAQERDPGWSPDDQRMSFGSDLGGRMEIYTVAREAAGWGKPVQLTRTGGIFPFWSPDGRTIVYNAASGLMLVSPDGGEPRPLPMTGPLQGKTNDFFALSWMPDSRHVLVVVPSDTVPYQTMWAVPTDSAEAPRPLIRFDDPYTAFGRGTFDMHDSTVYFGLLRSESDVWTADLSTR